MFYYKIMKYFVIIAFILISYINTSSVEYCDWNIVESKKECEDFDLYEADGEKYCCYIEYYSDSVKYKQCVPLTQKEYNEIDNYKTNFRDLYQTSLNIIDCNLFYLKAGLLYFLLILF